MSSEFMHFKVGQFDCTAIKDGDDWDRNVLLIGNREQYVLIDTGNGDATSPPGQLVDRLRLAGVSPAAINIVILTHADADHIGGAADAEGNIPFPQARYVLSQQEWDYWLSKPVRMQPNSVFDEGSRKLLCELPPVRLAQLGDKLELIDTEAEIAPGIRALLSPGHTPGLIVVEIASGSERLLFLVDVIYDGDLSGAPEEHPQITGNPEFHAAVDVDPAQAIVTRDRLLNQAAQERTLLMVTHMPFPGLGYVTKQGSGWQWIPYALQIRQ